MLEHQDLIEPEATNQGAWLCESAGAVLDLHATVLKSLCGFEPHGTRAPSPAGSSSSDHLGMGLELEGSHTGYVVPGNMRCGVPVHGAGSPDRGDGTHCLPVESSQASSRRERLRELGRVLARKRQFNASRQVGRVEGRWDRVLLVPQALAS